MKDKIKYKKINYKIKKYIKAKQSIKPKKHKII